MRLLFTRYRKLFLLLAAGVLTIYAILHFRQGVTRANASEPESGVRVRARAASAAAEEPLSLSLPRRNTLNQGTKSNLFAPTSWAAPAPAAPSPPPAAPPPPPQAPPMPYSFVGLLEDSAKPTAFLSNKEALLIVAAGQTIDGNYRVDTVNSKQVTLTYLPLNQKQVIRMQGEL
ncbi:MAG: hypothetical protein JWP38_3554 [Herbaspirillum sp.]|jgi:hypothetical protein|nr:hypothetical protein [Herbaspirillum sp.]